MRTAHIVYATDPTSQRTPFTIGNRLEKIFSERGYCVRTYDWDDKGTIKPSSSEDIIIGHPHPFPGSIFRVSVKNPDWRKRILMCPYNDHKPFTAYFRKTLDYVDGYIAVTGPYWASTKERREIIPFTNFYAQDLAVDSKIFPYSSQAQFYNNRVLFVGNKGYWKNPRLVERLASRTFDSYMPK